MTASRSTTCRVYNLQTGALIRSWRAHKLPVADMAVDASGGYVATASADRSVKVWICVGKGGGERDVMNFRGRWWMDGGLVSANGNRVEGGPLGL